MSAFVQCSFSFEVVSEGKDKTFIELSVENKTVIAKISYYNLSYYSKQMPQNYPNIDQRLGTLPPEFFQPPSRPYSEEFFRVKRENLSNASIYFVVLYNGQQLNITDENGNEKCSPAPKTDEAGKTNCTVTHFLFGGQVKEVDSEKSCILVKASFLGEQIDKKTYKPSSQTVILCPKPSASALSRFGSSLALILSSNNLFINSLCFPLALLLSLLIAAMYYAGRNPLSLFDLTTPKLPHLRSFKMKSKASPQMMRSVARKYAQLQVRAAKSASKALAEVIRVRGKYEGKRKEEILLEVLKAKAKVHHLFHDLKHSIEASKGKGLTDAQIRNFERRLAALFGTAPEGRRAFKIWKKNVEMTLPFIQLYNAAYQTYSMTASGRGLSNSLVSRAIVTPLFNKLTKVSVYLEELKGIRAIGKIPIVKNVINTPTRIFDAIAQHRSSRLGALNLRRELIGGAVYTILNRLNMVDKAKNFMQKSGIEAFFKWTHKWSFDSFVAKHDLYNRKFRELYDPVENVRKLSIDAYNIAYHDLLRKLTFSLPTKMTMGEILVSMQNSIKDKKRNDQLKDDFRKLIDALENNRNINLDTVLKIARELKLSEKDVSFIRRVVELQDQWGKIQQALEAIMNKPYESHYYRLKALYDLAVKYGIDLKLGEDLNKWKDYEENVIRKIMLARMENGTYKPITWADVRNEFRSGASTRDIQTKFGGIVSKAEYERRMLELRNRVLSSTDAKTLKDNTIGTILTIRDSINAKINSTGPTTLFSHIYADALGSNPTAFYLNRRLAELGLGDIKVKNLDEFEIFFFRGTMSESLRRRLERIAADNKRTVDDLLKDIMVEALRFQVSANIANIRIAELIFGDTASRKSVFSDIFGSRAEKQMKGMIKLHEQLEYSFQRISFNYSPYDLQKEALFNQLRVSERSAGFFIWGTKRGGSNADSVMWLLDSTFKHNADAVGMLRAFYNNLINRESRFYDEKFAQKIKEGDFVSNYDALRARGYNFLDVRNGLGILLRGDKKGNLPLLEYDPTILSQYRYNSEIVKKGEVRDLGALFARIADSPYVYLPSGVVVLSKFTDSSGRISWLYGAPLKSKEVERVYREALQDPTFSRTSELSNKLVGFDKDGNYRPSTQLIKVIYAKDLQEIKNNPDNFFGYVSPFEKFRSRIRTGLHKLGELFGEMYYSATDYRASQLEKWYAAQYQMRMILDSYERSFARYMTPGTKRYDPSSYIEDLKSEGLKTNDQLRIRVANTMEKLKRGEGGWLDTLRATFDGFRRNLAAKIVNEVAEAESAWYAAKLELRAIEKLKNEGAITKDEYKTLREEALSKISGLKESYKELKEEYKQYNELARYWASSHDNTYGTARNIFKVLPVFTSIFDSKFVQGAKIDYYFITESSAMRDPRTATGAGVGLDYSFYVGYQTGQTVYERPRFWTTNALWEEQLRLPLMLSYAVHKWFYPAVSQATRDRSHYPSYLEMDALYPGRPHNESRLGKHDLFMPMVLAPLRRHYSSDYWRTRFQALLDFSGASSLIGAYFSTSPSQTEASFFRRTMEKMFLPSPHYSTEARFLLSQRTLDQFKMLDEAREKYSEVKEAIDTYINSIDGSEAQRKALETISKYVEISDRRPIGVQRGVSGSDMEEDGSRNRFMNLYVGFHQNIWKPTVPGLMDTDPISGKWRAFPQTAMEVYRAPEESKLDNLRQFNLPTYDEKTGRFVLTEQLHNYDDAMREVYKRESTLLIHLLKYQHELQSYTILNSPAVLVASPGIGSALAFNISRFFLSKTRLGSSITEEEASFSERFFTQSWYSSIAKRWALAKNSWNELLESTLISRLSGASRKSRLEEDALKLAIYSYSNLSSRGYLL
ncbi:MAG: hypothetical protein N3G80_00725 [Candidatus Micrarchaeota archaeon]|nr:hypothetical protein [Candidatus Micrarchaeota archaeon]